MRNKHHVGHILLVFILLVLVSPTLNAQRANKHATYSEDVYEGMRYGLFKPVGYNSDVSYPVVIYLHGSGDTTSWDHSWYQSGSQAKNPSFVLTPKSKEANLGWGSTFFKGQSGNMRKTLDILNDLILEYNINTNRIYICGTSMGGFGVYSVLAEEENKFAAAYVICGGGTTQSTMKYLETPLWIFHGDSDPIVPVKMSRDIYKELIDHDAKVVRYTEYPGVEHNSWVNANNERTLSKWMFMQEKGTKHGAPDAIGNLILKTNADGEPMLKWEPPTAAKSKDKEVWYYKLYNGDKMVAEIGNHLTVYSEGLQKGETYHLVAVNYFFIESNPSNQVSVK